MVQEETEEWNEVSKTLGADARLNNVSVSQFSAL